MAEGYEHLVKNRRQVSDNIDEADPLRRLGTREKGANFAPFSFRQILEFIIFLPLNFVPYAGVPLFLLATGYRAGPLLNWRYFAMKGLNKKQRTQFVTTKKRRWEYMWFGTTHMALQLIPVLGMFFLLTVAAGSALWTVRVEQELREGERGSDERDLPPPYTDEYDDDV